LEAPLALSVGLRQLFSRAHSGFIRTVTALSVLGLAIGVAALLILNAFMSGFTGSIMRSLGRVNPPVVVKAPGGYSLDEADLRLVDSLVAGISGLRGVSPRATRTVILAGPSGEVAGAELWAVSWEGEASTTRLRELLGGDGTGSGILLGRDLAARLEAEAGSPLSLASTESATVSGMGTAVLDTIVRAEVEAVADLGIEDYNAGVVVAGMEAAAALMGTSRGYSSIGVGAEPGTDPVAAAARLSSELRKAYVDSRHPTFMAAEAFLQQHSNLFAALGLERLAMTIVLALITVVALLNLSSALAMVALEHRRDLGVLRAMGASPGFLLRTCLSQGGLIGLSGALAGTGFAFAVIYTVNSWLPIRLEGSVYWIEVLSGRFQPLLALALAAATVAACLLASVVPALSALSISPSAAVRYE
jgi:lipoprotein-releasing system permease protein